MLSVLIVDDASEDLILAERVLRSCQIRNPIHRLTTGEECIAWFNSKGKVSPALVFLDLAMVPVSGLDVLRALEQNSVARESFFVMLSGRADQKMLREGYQLGAKTFLIKPLKCEEVTRLLASSEDRIRAQKTDRGIELIWSTPSSPVRAF
jgi:CheY-like chemotaxis protein